MQAILSQSAIDAIPHDCIFVSCEMELDLTLQTSQFIPYLHLFVL